MNLTLERLKELLHYDPETGAFTRLVQTCSRIRVGDVAGCLHKTTRYLVINVCGVKYLAHRLAWFYMNGVWPDLDIDHENTIKSDNKWKNLREVTHSVNMQNQRKAHSNNKTGLQGVIPNGKYFQAQIGLDDGSQYLGSFPTAELAHQTYLNAKREMHPGCTL